MQYRHECKHEISYSDMITLRQRLHAVAYPDPHTINGKYFIRSLYMDTPSDKALREKMIGVSRREKFRIRYYNGDTSLIHLEKKVKVGSLGCKYSTSISAEQAQAIVDGDIKWMMYKDDELLHELYTRMRNEQLEAKTVVDYTREPFIFPAGNVRVTLDYDIRTGLRSTDFLNTNLPTVPAGEAHILLEVKWDEFLPSIIRDAVLLDNRHTSAFSKYEQCRIYESIL